MKKINLAILGATGAVGREMLKVLYERNFPIGELRALASAKSAGTKLPFGNTEVTVMEANDDAFIGMDVVLGAVSNAMSKK
ncbi:MAG: aspartate-semialdehyde dehydrogenase, partial [Clostridia bacterium]|nr:aspartate-semialdehyde dehydrogenase [Clostridia bacterium]